MKLAITDRSLLLRTPDPSAVFAQARSLGMQGVELSVSRADLHDAQPHRMSRPKSVMQRHTDSLGMPLPSARSERGVWMLG